MNANVPVKLYRVTKMVEDDGVAKGEKIIKITENRYWITIITQLVLKKSDCQLKNSKDCGQLSRYLTAMPSQTVI